MLRVHLSGAILVIGLLLACRVSAQHTDIFIGHSPPHPDPPGGVECPTLDPLKLFLADNAAVGGQIPPGGGDPANPGAVIELNPVAFSSNLADPARGGFVCARNDPGFNFIGVDNPCHGMSTAFTGGQFFETFLERILLDDGVNFAMTQNVTPILLENGTEWMFGDSNDGGHQHPFFLVHRPGQYLGEFRVSASIVFSPSDSFTLRFTTNPECFVARPVDMSGIFNADVVDSDLEDSPVAFDGADHYWLLNDLYGTDRGISVDGVLDVFQLGGPDGSGLIESNLNCLFDDGSHTSAAALDLNALGIGGSYLSAEFLVGATGDFTCVSGQACEKLVVRMGYDAGADQVVNFRRLALPASFDPIYVPLNDWHVPDNPPPLLAVGPSGRREGGGFVRSDGSGVDEVPDPVETFYFQRVTFPLDTLRALQLIEVDDYTDAGNVGIFAITLIEGVRCCDGDFDDNGFVDLLDYGDLSYCADLESPVIEDPDCAVFDCNRNDDVDLLDFGAFQVFFNGETE